VKRKTPKRKKSTPAKDEKALLEVAAEVKAEIQSEQEEWGGGRLTAQRRSFAYAYLKLRNGTAAYKKVYGPMEDGVAAAAASRLLKDVKVAALIAEGEERIARRAEIDAAFVVDGALEVLERALQRRPVEYFDKAEKMMVQATDEDGNDIWQFDSNGAMKALTLLSKHTGGFSERIQHDVSEKLEDILAKSWGE
jgi:phage terminase small subunit